MSQQRKRKSGRVYKGPVKWVQYVLARGVIGFLGALPISVNFSLGRFVGWVTWACMPGRRRVVSKNLRIIHAHLHGDAPFEPDLKTQVKSVFLHAGVNILCGFSLGRMDTESLKRHIEIEGIEQFSELVLQGKGVIVIMSHMGPWEALVNMKGYYASTGVEANFGAVYRRFNNDYVDEWFVDEREAAGTRLFASQHNFYAPSDFLRAGGVLGILSDQRATRGETISFFGKQVQGTPLPGLLHQRTKSPMIAISLCTVGKGRWKLRFYPVDSLADQENVGRQELANVCAKATEQCLSQSVPDGFWLHNRFK